MKIKTAHIALILAILALAVSLFTAVQVSQNDNAALIDALMAQNQQLQAQIDALSGGQITDVPGQTESGNHAATLTAVSWADGSGADVILTAEGSPEDGAALRVMLGSRVITEVPCSWDGSVLTATVPVPADNGYTYSLIVGSEAKTLASPENPVYPELVYLADSLTAYCNLVVGEWHVRDDMLNIENAYASIHTPQLGSAAVTCDSARILLKHGGTVLDEIALSPAPDGDAGSYTCSASAIAMALPDLPDGDQVDLWLEATLSGGQVLTHCAATWYAMPGGFSMAAG